MKTFLKKFLNQDTIPLILLHTVFLIIFLTNLHPGSTFIGWDSINPEQNIALNFKRIFSSAWQEYYGLGLLGGHGFAALFPHTLIVYLFSFIFPQWAIRTIYTLFFLYLGTVGMYVLIQYILRKISFKIVTHLHFYANWIALIGSFFYLMNLGTIQQLYTQTEAFTFHFLALPWLFFAVILLLENFTRKRVIFFIFINFITSTQGFVPPIFVAYALGLVFFLTSYILYHGLSLSSIKSSVIIGLLTILINAYWILPFGYYQLNNGNIFLNSYNNIMQTPQFIEKNKKYGDLPNMALIKGFFWENQQSSEYIYKPWRDHQEMPFVRFIGYTLFAVSFFGLLISLWKAKHWIIYSFGAVYLYFFMSLATNFPPFSYITDILQVVSPTYRQAFRTAFTKFSLGLGFSYSIFLAIGLLFIIHFLTLYLKKKRIIAGLLIIILVSVLYYGFPYMKGYAFDPALFNRVPSSYSELINFFKDKGDGRIADFPQDCAEGWYFYNWGYFGSGFLWYGIKQPYLSRTFDVWSNNNENYYWEITQALREQDMSKVDKVIEKYNVRWLVYDPNSRHCRTEHAFSYLDAFEDYLSKSSKYELVKTLSNDKLLPIKIYEYKKQQSNSYISLISELKNIGPSYKWNDNDIVFQNNNTYKTDVRKSFDLYFPFRSIFTKRSAAEKEFFIETKEDSIIIKNQLLTNLQGYQLAIPSYLDKEKVIPINIKFYPSSQNIYDIILSLKLPKVTLDDKLLSTPSPSIKIGQIKTSNLQSLQILVNGIDVSNSFKLNQISTILSSKGSNTIRIFDQKNTLLFQWIDSSNGILNKTLAKNTVVRIPSYTKGELSVEFPKVYDDGIYGKVFTSKDIIKKVPTSCDGSAVPPDSKYEINPDEQEGFMRLISQNDYQCLVFSMPQAETGLNYIVETVTRKHSGGDLLFLVTNKRHIDYIESYIGGTASFNTSHYIVSQNLPHELGYDFIFKNISYNEFKTINDIQSFAAWYIPYNFITSLQIQPLDESSSSQNISKDSFQVNHPFETLYTVHTEDLRNLDDKTLVLYQGYHEGWQAYAVPDENFFTTNIPFLFGKKLEDHILINNWANGWEINKQNSNNFVIIFWPQYLEFIGIFFLFGGSLFVILFAGKIKERLSNN